MGGRERRLARSSAARQRRVGRETEPGAAVAARSPALGMAAGLGLFLGDFLLSCLGPAGPHVQLGPYSIINNSYGLFSSIMGDRFDVTGGLLFPMAETMTLPDPGRALGTLLLYSAGTLSMAYLFFREQDIL